MQIPDAIIEKAARLIHDEMWGGGYDEDDHDARDEARRQARRALEAVVSDIVAARDHEILMLVSSTGEWWSYKLVDRIRALPGLFGEQGEESD